MRLLVAAVGTEPDDWAWTIPGELVVPLQPCDAADPDIGGLGEHCTCGCVVGFLGVVSHKGTTAAVVDELDLDRTQLELIAGDADEADAMLAAAGDFPIGTVVRRRLDHVEAR